ncbi:MAG: GAF domain-containing protein [Ardenticatenaceae bacterium]|nr:GAF domain-containing protein [Anaerolineales bacterium]MCB8920354.1 GAF domain-containing protein [Ardenticatenaceae bacterium]MCB8989309.1 GAF domain-containing protein [Ardenticatenaceae bacterium]
MSDDLRETLRFIQNQNVALREENEILRDEVASLQEILDILLTLQDMSMSVTTHTDALTLLDRILQAALESIGASNGSLILVDPETNELVFAAVHGEIRDELVGYRLPIGEGVAGWVAAHGEPVRLADVGMDSRFSPEVDQTFEFATRSMLCVPMICGDRVVGVIEALNKEGDAEFIDAELALLGIIARLAAATVHRAETAVSTPVEAAV